jgi:hypothetical protein
MNFQQYFDRVRYVIINVIFGIQNYIKTNDEKFIKYFYIDYDVHYYPAKFQIKIQLVYEKK